jgi:hypothetical protein
LRAPRAVVPRRKEDFLKRVVEVAAGIDMHDKKRTSRDEVL